jgi:hypothetical protein
MKEIAIVNTSRTSRALLISLFLVAMLALGALVGCSGGSGSSSGTAGQKAVNLTAKQALDVAMSALSTSAPDGKLLLVQTGKPITATDTAIWEFLVGSPKTDAIYQVLVRDGKATVQPYGPAKLSAAQWGQVPANADLKVDSDAAHKAAVGVYTNGTSAAYVMGLVTFIPPTAKVTNEKAMVWVVDFDPASKGSAATSTVNVDGKTGTAALAK